MIGVNDILTKLRASYAISTNVKPNYGFPVQLMPAEAKTLIEYIEADHRHAILSALRLAESPSDAEAVERERERAAEVADMMWLMPPDINPTGGIGDLATGWQRACSRIAAAIRNRKE